MSTTRLKWTVYPAGDRSLVVVFDDADPMEANKEAGLLARALPQHQLVGVQAIVPGMVSVALHYEPAEVLQAAQAEAGTTNWLSPYEWLQTQLTRILLQPRSPHSSTQREIEIPVCYGGEYGPDLVEVAKQCQLSCDEVIHLHTAHVVNVLMLGFAPGHPYIGRFSEQLSVGRRVSPRTMVKAGSVGLANRQSVIYPMNLPGGWQLIGRTPLRLFDATQHTPSLLSVGDQLRFVAISANEFADMVNQQEVKA